MQEAENIILIQKQRLKQYLFEKMMEELDVKKMMVQGGVTVME